MSDSSNGNGYAGRDVATQMKLMAWFTKNKPSLLHFESRSEVCKALLADTGLSISLYTCGEYEKALGISRSAGKGRLQPGTNKSKSSEVLARALYAVMQELSNLMQEAASGETWAIDSVIPLDQWEQHMNAVKTVAQRRSMKSLDTDTVPVAPEA